MYVPVIKRWVSACRCCLCCGCAGDPEREGVLDGVKAAVCANINLFMEMNEEEFAKYLQTFVTDVWHLLMQVRGGGAG
jgi:hypothetical protein